MQRMIAAALMLAALALQHIVHELSHALAAKCCGIKVLRIQWLTYRGGTRVFFENEPDFDVEKPIDKKWAVIAGAGIAVTSVIGYICAALVLLPGLGLAPWGKLLCTFIAVAFLMVDSLYFLLGSVLHFGDVVGLRKTLGITKPVSVLLCLVIAIVNITLAVWVYR